MEENKEIEVKEEVKVDETKTEEVKEPKEESKVEDVKIDEPKEEESKTDDNKYSKMEERLKALEEANKQQAEALKEQTIKNTILEKISDKELQKAVLETGLVKSVEDIDNVLKIVELSKSLNKTNFSDGYKPTDNKQADGYQQAEKKGNVLDMIKQKMSKQ